MTTNSCRPLEEACPVKGSAYWQTLARAKKIKPPSAAIFLTQWYAFSASIPEILCIAAMKASCEAERANIIENLYSEMGLDADGRSHPELLKDLIQRATGTTPKPDMVSATTKHFLNNLKRGMLEGNSAFNAGVMLSLEGVAYNILGVLKEILRKSGNTALVNHPYIAIHEEIEAQHIDNTEENVKIHQGRTNDVQKGMSFMNFEWKGFWNSAYLILVISDV